MGPAQYSELAALFSILFIISVPAQVAQTIMTKFFSERKANNDIGGAKSLLLKTYQYLACLLYTSPSPRDRTRSRMPSSA